MSLTVKPISAQLIKNYDLNSKQDPYCTITIGQQTQSTSPHKQAGLHPVWNDVLVFNLTDEKEIKVQVYDKDLISDDFIGEGKIEIETVKNSKSEEEVISLVDKKGEHAGSLMIKIFIGEQTKGDIQEKKKKEEEQKKQEIEEQKDQNQ